jgi:hypothetical protein
MCLELHFVARITTMLGQLKEVSWMLEVMMLESSHSTNFCFLLQSTMAYVNKPKAHVTAKAYHLSVTTYIRHAARIFLWGDGGLTMKLYV